MTRALTEPTAALTVVEPRAVARAVDDPAELEEDEIREVLLHHDQRALLFGIGAGILCGPLAALAVETMWAAPLIAAVAAGIGGVVSQVVRRREAARALGITVDVVNAVEREFGRATAGLLVDDVRARRFKKLLLRSPAEQRAELAARIRARLQAKRRG